MKFTVMVYFAGPKSRWAQKVDPTEVIFSTETSWLWLARFLAKSNLGSTGRCGYAIECGGVLVEHIEATDE